MIHSHFDYSCFFAVKALFATIEIIAVSCYDNSNSYYCSLYYSSNANVIQDSSPDSGLDSTNQNDDFDGSDAIRRDAMNTEEPTEKPIEGPEGAIEIPIEEPQQTMGPKRPKVSSHCCYTAEAAKDGHYFAD